jgi:competence protein ComEA
MFKKMVFLGMVACSTSLFAMSLSEVNKASKDELMAIKGIGEAKADAIIAQRSKGKFKTMEEIMDVSGIGEATLENIKKDVKSGEKSESKKSDKDKTSQKSQKDK